MAGALKLGRRALLAALGSTTAAAALGRTPYGGRLRLSVPWPVESLDPHSASSPEAALFGPAVAEPLFALDSRGRPYPTLAEALPERAGDGLLIRLRPALVTAAGRTLDARDLAWSLRRARAAGASSLLAGSKFVIAGDDGRTVVVKGASDADALAWNLSSPLTALLPRAFHSARPDGTGPFTASPSRTRMVLRRNPRAARGPSYLDRIEVDRASTLTEALRSYEVGDADVGWLGNGLHRPRPRSRSFDAGAFGWIVLATGRDAGSWGAPGIAQSMLDAIPSSRLERFALGKLPNARGTVGWGGPSAPLIVRHDAPYLLELAEALAQILSRPGHELSVSPRSKREIAQRRRDRRFALMLDMVRRPAPGMRAAQLALRAAANPGLARHPTGSVPKNVRSVTRSLPLGVVGELRAEGAHQPGVVGLSAWSLGDLWRP